MGLNAVQTMGCLPLPSTLEVLKSSDHSREDFGEAYYKDQLTEHFSLSLHYSANLLEGYTPKVDAGDEHVVTFQTTNP
jgi:hypothetical protein